MPAFDRTDRISEEVRKALDHIIRDELNDPRIAGTWSIVRADVTRDLRFCKVRVSVFEEDRREPLMAALKSASGYIRRALGKAVDLRYTPELLFEEDINIAYADKINRILKEQGNADDQRTHPVD